MNASDNPLSVPAEAVVSRLTAQIGQLYSELAVAQVALEQAYSAINELHNELTAKTTPAENKPATKKD